MGKGKKGGKRMNKKQVTEALVNFFQTQPVEEYNFKQIFRTLHLDTHPLRMLAIDVMEELAWDDFLSNLGHLVSAQHQRAGTGGHFQAEGQWQE